MTSNTTEPRAPLAPEPRCSHTVDNGNGITWHCVLKPHPEDQRADAHYMVRDELSARRNG